VSVLRRLEKGVRRLILGVLVRGHTWPLDQVLGDLLPSSPRILLIRVDRIGDAILTTPLLPVIRSRFPDGSIDILLGEKNQVIASLLLDVDQRIVLRRSHVLKTIRELRQRRYDVVINLHLKRSAGASLIARLAGGRQILEHGTAEPGPAAVSESEGGATHMVALTSRILAPIGVSPIDDSVQDQHSLKLKIPAASIERARTTQNQLFDSDNPKSRVFLNLSSSSESRRWPATKWGQLAHDLAVLGFHPVLCGTIEDSEAFATAAAVARGSGVILPPTPSYPDFAANLTMADLVISADGSTIHLASALGIPTVGLYKAESTAITWAPWGVPHRTISSPGGLQALQTADVISAVEDLSREKPS